MASNLQITRYLNKLLDIKNIPDSSKNGMQIRASDEIKKIGFAVDACMDVFEKAKKEKCDMVLVHHGLFWAGKPILKVVLDERIKYLKEKRLVYMLHISHSIYIKNMGII